MRITVLGKSPAWQDAGGACSGYLVEEGDTCLLLDCGSGVFGRLRAHRDYHEVDAVVLSHLHADHMLDLVPYAYGLSLGPRGGARPVLHAPPGAADAFRQLAGAWHMEEVVLDAFDVREYDSAAPLQVGSLRLRLQPVPHYLPTCAVEIAGPGGRFVFGADTAPDDDLAAFARGADLLMLEATIPVPEPEGPRGHLTAREAGVLAREAGARRLVLTHFSDELDAEHLEREARAAFGGEVLLAHADATYVV